MLQVDRCTLNKQVKAHHKYTPNVPLVERTRTNTHLDHLYDVFEELYSPILLVFEKCVVKGDDGRQDGRVHPFIRWERLCLQYQMQYRKECTALLVENARCSCSRHFARLCYGVVLMACADQELITVYSTKTA